MLSIILLILKIIGITLLVIVGVVLLILMLILFIPVRYKLTAGKKADNAIPLSATAKATWLLHILSACYEYKDNKTGLTIRIFGIRIKDREERRRLKEERRRRKKHKNDEKNRCEDGSISIFEYDEDSWEIKEKNIKENGRTHIFVDEHEESSDVGEVIRSETINKEAGVKPPALDVYEEQEKNDLFNKLYELYGRLSERARNIIRRIKSLIERILNKVTGLSQNIGYYKNALFNDKRNSEVLDLLFKKTKILIKAVIPRRIKGHIDYGSDDPADTGRFLAAAAVLYPLYGKSIIIEPYFEEQILAFDLMMRGRIYIFTLVSIFLQLYFNRKVKRFIHIMKKENGNG